MVLIQKNRDNCQAMLEINESLKMLKEENQRVIEDLRLKHSEEIDQLQAQKAHDISEILAKHEDEKADLRQALDLKTEQFKQENNTISQVQA